MTDKQQTEPTECVVNTEADVAKFFHGREETIRDWRKRGMPGDPGS